jgi:hypothetical protein
MHIANTNFAFLLTWPNRLQEKKETCLGPDSQAAQEFTVYSVHTATSHIEGCNIVLNLKRLQHKLRNNDEILWFFEITVVFDRPFSLVFKGY